MGITMVNENIEKTAIESRLIRYGELLPCKAAFIDAHTPGSDQKENFTIIGAGVSESSDQHVHLALPHGFNIGAAGQPPRCRNSLHSHRTAEVFFVLKGKWRFFWGRWGTAGEVILEEGDIINIPTGIFRGFENVGTDYGMIMAILGGDDAGGGVIWAPQVLEDAKNHGLILSEHGKLYDTKKNQSLPLDVKPMPGLTDNELSKFPELLPSQVIPNHVARYLDLLSISKGSPAKVIGIGAKLVDRPGFEVEFISRDSLTSEVQSSEKINVLMPVKGHWQFNSSDFSETLNPGDTFSVPENLDYSLKPSMTGESSLYRVIPTDDPAGPTWSNKK
jgi:quercetin dioxygenase-like cupin family protein